MYIYRLKVWAPIFKGFSFKGLSFSIASVWILSKRDDKALVSKGLHYFSIATPSMKAVISFRPGVNIKTNSIKLSHKQSLEKLSSQNKVCYNNKGFVWDANMTVISFFALLFSCLRVGGGGGEGDNPFKSTCCRLQG